MRFIITRIRQTLKTGHEAGQYFHVPFHWLYMNNGLQNTRGINEKTAEPQAQSNFVLSHVRPASYLRGRFRQFFGEFWLLFTYTVESRLNVQVGTQKFGRRTERDVQVKVIFRITPCKVFWMRLYQ